MPYILDAEVGAALAGIAEKFASLSPLERGDWRTLRDNGNAMMADWAVDAPADVDITTRSFSTLSKDGLGIDLRWYARRGAPSGSAIVYAHGGGMIAGSVDLYDPVVKDYVLTTGVPFLSVNYRLAPEAKCESLAEDVFSGLGWLVAHASELGVDPGRIAVMGDSAGGGVAAGAAILARDRGIPLSRQILIYPMLDDRNLTPEPNLAAFANWTYDNNYTGWSALLGDAVAGKEVSPIAAPARLRVFDGLCDAYIEVGELDIFRDEDIAYAQKLMSAGISTELHVHPGAPHGYERVAPGSQLARRAMADRARVIRTI